MSRPFFPHVRWRMCKTRPLVARIDCGRAGARFFKNVCRAPRYRRLYSQRVFAEMAPRRGQSSGTKSRPAAQNALECTAIRECTLYGYVPPLNAFAMHALCTERTYRAIRFAAIDAWCFWWLYNAISQNSSRRGRGFYFGENKEERRCLFIALKKKSDWIN